MNLRPLSLAALAITLFCSACTARLVPLQTATARVNPQDNSVSETHDEVTLTVRLDELSVASYELASNITSFQVVIDNRSAQTVEIPVGAFMLIDGENRQYHTITPDELHEIVSRDTVYLIPHPYVGYYYLSDQVKADFVNETSSSLPFYAQYHPQEIYANALPEGPVLAGAKQTGLIYFVADPVQTGQAELLVYRDPTLQGSPIYRFPFAVDK